jgi:hypothetical protein
MKILNLLPHFLVSFLLLALTLSISSCATTPVDVVAQEGGGDIYAQYELGGATTAAQAATAVSALKLLATDLPLIPAGKLSQSDSGYLSGVLQQAKAGIPVSASTQKVLDDLNSIISLVASNLGGGNGGMTGAQGLAVADFTNVAVGITNAIAYKEGEWKADPSKAGWPTS